MKINRKASLQLPLAETVYDPDTRRTRFALYDAGEIYYQDSIELEGVEIQPLDAKSDLVAKNVVLLPSEATGYGTEAELLTEVQAFIHRRCDVSAEFETIAAHYVLLTWLHDRLNELPYLRVRGDYGSGKSRFLTVVGSICYRPIFTAGATTTSPIFRILDQVRGTLVLDEADFRFSDFSNDLVKILNSGYQKGTAVLRSEGKGVFEVKSYDVYGPKVIATRQNYDDAALESRFLIEDMGRKKLRSDIPIRLDDSFRGEALALRNKLLTFRFRNYNKPLVFDDERIEGLHPRLQQIIIPLLAILPSDAIQTTLIAHARRYNQELIADRAQSWEAQVILAIFRLHENTQLDSLAVKDIAVEVNNDAEIGETITAKKTGWVMRSKLQLKPERISKGYMLSFSRNEERLEYWRERLGITDEDIKGNESDVHVSTTAYNPPEIDPADIPF
jgi:hypothetical protein